MICRAGKCLVGSLRCQHCRDTGPMGAQTRQILKVGRCPFKLPDDFKSAEPLPVAMPFAAEPDQHEEVDDATYEVRRRSCFGGDGAEPCVMLTRTEAGNFCGACRCGQFPKARLDAGATPKLRWAKVTCPLGRPWSA